MTRPVLEAGVDGAFDADSAAHVVALQDAKQLGTEDDAGLCSHAFVYKSHAYNPVDEAKRLRLRGNTAFQAKSFVQACEYYTQALAIDPINHLLYSNRSAAHYQLGEYSLAMQDATQTITLSPQWAKGYARKAAACEALGLQEEAVNAYDRVIQLSVTPNGSGSSTIDVKKASAKLHHLRSSIHTDTVASSSVSISSSSLSPVIRKGFFHCNKAKATSSIYKDKGEVVHHVVDRSSGLPREEKPQERQWRRMLHQLKTGCNPRGENAEGHRVVLDDGVFARLLQRDAFQALIYPGISRAQLSQAPQSLQELLEDPWYANELLELMPKVKLKAESVLANVKARGAAQGDVMDEQTERMLLPQVQQEAFGREVVAMVHRVNAKKHVLLANDVRTLADPASEQAQWNQLPTSFLEELLRDGSAVLEDFMGSDEWSELLQNDVARLIRSDSFMDVEQSRTSSIPLTGRALQVQAENGAHARVKAGRMRFVERGECDREYPALAELLAKLHALPHEINAKKGEQHAQLCAQFAHCTAVHQLRMGEAQPLRLDCGVGEQDNGFKLTCVYFLRVPPESHEGGEGAGGGGGDRGHGRGGVLQLRKTLEADAHVQSVLPRRDRLVMFRSPLVLNEITPIVSEEEKEEDTELWYVTFWIHGRLLRGLTE